MCDQPVERKASVFDKTNDCREIVGTPLRRDAQAQPSSGSLPMYRHPADRNAAATGVVLGKSLDITG